MYSVLIQNGKTMESFRQFYSIFMEAIDAGNIGVCQWMEAGTTIDTTVPELYNLTNDKEEWRAIIVRIEDDECADAFPASPANPYDFIANTSADICTRENPVPLVRLTQMLGGVPAPPMRFECDILNEANKAPRMIYRPVIREADQAAYRELSDKYHFDGKPPSEIILVSLRFRQDNRLEKVQKIWQLPKEADSSEFWKRNGYPSICRFTFYEMERQGPVQKTADLFKAWTAVLLFALNEIDPSTLQAYKLHRIEVEFDRETMCSTIQKCVSRTLGIRQFISKSIQHEIEEKINQESTLPDYRLVAPVVLKVPARKNYYAKPEAFNLTAESGTSDMAAWKEMQETAEACVRGVNTCAQRALDRTADRMRHYCCYTDSEVLPLDAYQTEDLRNELELLYNKVFDLRAELPCHEAADMEAMDVIAKSVKDKILRRVTTRQAVWGYLIAAAVFILSFIPAVTLFNRQHLGSWQGIVLAVIVSALSFAGAELLLLLVQQGELRAGVRRFNSFVTAVVTRVSESASKFSCYMGDIVSHVHGSSYLLMAQRRRFLRNEAQHYKQNHVTALNLFLADLKQWSMAFHLPVSFEAAEVDDSFVMEPEIAPCHNPMYTFESHASYSVPVNHTGDQVEAPFGFIRRFNIIREELYDDAR